MTPRVKPVGVASSIYRDEDNAIATHPCDHSHLYQQLQQQPQHDDACRTLNEIKDVTSEASVIALRSNSSLFTNAEARSPLLQQIRPSPLVSELQMQRHHLQAVEHSDEKQDSGIYELTTKLNR